MNNRKKIAVIGGGAAGFFAALSAAKHHPEAEIYLFEKTNKLLSKVKISGGGRCNVTHDCTDINTLLLAYPRGKKKLKSIFYQFSVSDTIAWFEQRNVALKTEKDGRMFPTTDSSQTIVDALLHEAKKHGIRIQTKSAVEKMEPSENGWTIYSNHQQIAHVDAVIVSTGGHPKKSNFEWLEKLGHRIAPPVPSLFTFNMPHEKITSLMGVVAKNTSVHLLGTKITSVGELLITHWGMSGPAILKASAFGAEFLAEKEYQFQIRVQWDTSQSPEEWRTSLSSFSLQHPHKQLSNLHPFTFPNRLWKYVLEKLAIDPEKRWNELGKKNSNRIVELITNDVFSVEGKTTFKEEFVTCGGIELSDVNTQTMESKKAKHLYFAGEVLNIDAITGGYNFQAAWSTGFVAGQLK